MAKWYSGCTLDVDGKSHEDLREIASGALDDICNAAGGTVERIEIDYPHGDSRVLAWKALISHE